MRYNTPEAGSLDWHIPLNENFTKLDNDVEIRDASGNRGQYEPTAGAKFLATDTGAVYLGDGSQWKKLGDIVPEQTSGSGDGSIVAPPGDVQAAIDSAAASGGGVVRLNPAHRYEQPSSPWVVKRDVVLDFNGAVLYGTGSDNNTDIIHLAPSGQVHNPKIDLWDGGNAYDNSNKFSANVFTLDGGKYGQYFAKGTTIRGGWTGAVESDGTWIYMTPAKGAPVAFVTIETNLTRPPGAPGGIHTLATGIHLDSGTEGWINSVQCYGNWRDALTTIKQTGEEMNFGHVFDAFIQPPSKYSDPLPNAIWEINGKNIFLNRLEGIVWDVFEESFPNQNAWLIDGWAGDNSLQTLHPTTGSAVDLSNFTTSNTSGTNYVTNPITFETKTV